MTKVVLVTGGSRGIGAAVAIACARAGWRVAVNYRTAEPAARRVVAAIAAAGGEAIALGGDVGSEAEVQALFAVIRKRFGRLDGLVNSAGILPPVARFEEFSLARWQHTFAVNVTGTFLCIREAVRMMAPRHGGAGGAIVNLSSMAASLGGAGDFVDYAATKGAIESLTVGLSKELGPDGIRVNAVRPGLIDTEIHASAQDGGRVARLAAGVPLGRAGSADEAAAAILWLLSDAASYVTGATLAVSGGR